MRKLLLCCAAMLLLVAAACADDGGTNDQPDPTEEPVATQPACTDEEPEAPAKQDAISEEAPVIPKPEGEPPCDLVIQDIVEGDGAEAPEGATVTVNYVGVLWDTGEEFDSSYGEDGGPATFPLDGVIAGWTNGIPGMKENGRRKLIIPPDQAYGVAGRPGIPPNATLVFIVDLIRVAEATSPEPTG